MFCLGSFCPGGFWQGGFVQGGFVRGLMSEGVFVLEPLYTWLLKQVSSFVHKMSSQTCM